MIENKRRQMQMRGFFAALRMTIRKEEAEWGWR